MRQNPPDFSFDNSYRRLPDRFHARLPPEPVAEPRLVALNRPLCHSLGLDPDALQPAAAAIFAGNTVPAGAQPIAMAYAGHQFGQFVPQLGDGRAILLGEVLDDGGRRRDIQLKGSGPTPYSRGGDGRAPLGPVLREYLVSEAMHELGIPTTRSLAAVTTGENVYRDRLLPGAVVTRVASSHVRVGTFQFFAARGDEEGVRQLADYVIARHYPEVRDADRPYLSLLEAIADRQASLVARWMLVGFIHGVMNTDNMTVSGETIDYGPCAFMDAYDPATVFSSIDHRGRYAFSNQPRVAQWNLARLAETLLPLIDKNPERSVDAASAVVEEFSQRFEAYWLDGMRGKLGFGNKEADDLLLVQGLLDAMRASAADFTLTFHRITDAATESGALAGAQELFTDKADFDDWSKRWQQRLARDPQPAEQRTASMRRANPVVIPRNHLVEQALTAAVDERDFSAFERLHAVLQRPFEEGTETPRFMSPPEPGQRVLRTFCGT